MSLLGDQLMVHSLGLVQLKYLNVIRDDLLDHRVAIAGYVEREDSLPSSVAGHELNQSMWGKTGQKSSYMFILLPGESQCSGNLGFGNHHDTMPFFCMERAILGHFPLWGGIYFFFFPTCL